MKDILNPPLDLEETPRKYTALDFAVLGLLQKVRTEILQPKTDRWKRLLEENNPTDRRLQPLAMNLAAGLLYVAPRPQPIAGESKGSTATLSARDPYKTLEAIYRGQLPDGWNKVLLDLLDLYSHLLFNSYYYVLTEAFGERALVPVIPGRTASAAPQDTWDIERIIFHNRFPFLLNKDYTDTYESQVLPLRGGLTPHFCWSFEQKLSLERVISVPYFLGDQSILLKQEDFVQRHLSALVAVIGAKPGQAHFKCAGAYVLTCAVPHVFRRAEQAKLADLITNAWETAIASDVHSILHRQDRGIRTRLTWEANKHDETLGQDVKHSLGRMLADLTDGTLALRVTFGEKHKQSFGRVAAVSLEGAIRAIRSSFPTGPWLSAARVKSDDDPAGGQARQPRIDVSKLRELCDGYRLTENLSSDTVARLIGQPLLQHIVRMGLGRGVIEVLLPEPFSVVPRQAGSTNVLDRVLQGVWSARIPAPKGMPAGYLFTFSSEHKDEPAIAKARERVCRSLVPAFSLQSVFGSGAARVFATLQTTWNRRQIFEETGGSASLAEPAAKTSPSAFGEDVAHPLLDALIDLEANDPTIRATLILTEHITYIPEKPASDEYDPTILNSFWLAYCSYASFWLFEALNHGYISRSAPLQSGSNLSLAEQFRKEGIPLPPRFWHPQPFKSFEQVEQTLAVDEPIVKVRVRLSADEEVNEWWVANLTYLGIPVWAWEGPEIEGSDRLPQESELVAEVGKCSIDNFYRDYLDRLLVSSTRVESIRRAFAGTGFEVQSIKLSKNGDHVQHDITFTAGTAGEYHCSVCWVPHSTAELAFCGLNADGILVANLDVGPDDAQSAILEYSTENNKEKKDERITRLCIIPSARSKPTNFPQQLTDTLIEHLRILHNRHLAIQGKTWEQVMSALTHELGHSLPSVDDLISSATDLINPAPITTLQRIGAVVKRRLLPTITLQQRIDLAQRSMRLLKLNIAAFGDTNDRADLFGSIYTKMPAAEGVPQLLSIAAELGFRLAAKRSQYSYDGGDKGEEEWYNFIRKFVRDTWMSGQGIEKLSRLFFWTVPPKDDRTKRDQATLKRRLGSQALLCATVANAVQHFALYLVKHSIKSAGGAPRLPMSDSDQVKSLLAGGLAIDITDSKLVIRNKANTDPSKEEEEQETEQRLKIGSLETVRFLLGKERFDWARSGFITYDPPIFHREANSTHGIYTLEVTLPESFWEIYPCL